MGRPADIVAMIGNCLNLAIGIGVEGFARLSLISGALNHVIQVWNDARRAERLAMFVKVNAPWIARALGKYLELMARRVIPPKPRVDRHSFRLRRARLGDGVRAIPLDERQQC